MKMFFSASKNQFFDGDIRDLYEASGSWPSDAKPVAKEVFSEFIGTPPKGKIRGAKKGLPCWVDAPAEKPTVEQVKARLSALTQRHLDSTARGLGYDNIQAAVSYAEEPAVPLYQQQGRALRAWRSLVWAALFEMLAEVEAGGREAPTEEELIAGLPAFKAPEAA